MNGPQHLIMLIIVMILTQWTLIHNCWLKDETARVILIGFLCARSSATPSWWRLTRPSPPWPGPRWQYAWLAPESPSRHRLEARRSTASLWRNSGITTFPTTKIPYVGKHGTQGVDWGGGLFWGAFCGSEDTWNIIIESNINCHISLGLS